MTHSTRRGHFSDYIGSERQHANDESREAASRNKEPWEGFELSILLEWDRTESGLDEVAELLERTREACRQRFYDTLAGRTKGGTHVTVTTTTTRVTRTRTVESYEVCPSCHFELPASKVCGFCE